MEKCSVCSYHFINILTCTKTAQSLDFFYNFPSLICRWCPAHTGETEDEDHESLPADAECGAAERKSTKEPE